MGHNQSCLHHLSESNINNGRGIFNRVAGNQINNVAVHLNLVAGRFALGRERRLADSVQLAEPFQGAVNSLLEVKQLLDELAVAFPATSSVCLLRKEVDDFLPVVICVALAMAFINDTSPQLSSNSYFHTFTAVAFECRRYLEQMPADIRGYQTHIADYLDASCLRQIFLTIFATYRWRPWLQAVLSYIRRDSATSKVLLKSLLTTIFGEELRHLITQSKLVSLLEIEHLTVNTFWVRQPAGAGWYAIPLDFCSSWKDLQLVIFQYCKNGPEGDYIRRGCWEIVHIADDSVVEKYHFAKVVRAEMRFDISIVMRLGEASLLSCPQCGHRNDRNCPCHAGWVSCLGCGKQFRIVSNSSVDVPGGSVVSSFMKAATTSLSYLLRRHKRQDAEISRYGDAEEPERSRANPQHVSARFHRISARVQHALYRDTTSNATTVTADHRCSPIESGNTVATSASAPIARPVVDTQYLCDVSSITQHHSHSSAWSSTSSPNSATDTTPTSPIVRQVVGTPAMSNASDRRRLHEPKFVCNQCSRTFTAKQSLKNHLRAHMDQRPFKCDVCSGVAFGKRSDLTRHNKSQKHTAQLQIAQSG